MKKDWSDKSLIMALCDPSGKLSITAICAFIGFIISLPLFVTICIFVMCIHDAIRVSNFITLAAMNLTFLMTCAGVLFGRHASNAAESKVMAMLPNNPTTTMIKELVNTETTTTVDNK